MEMNNNAWPYNLISNIVTVEEPPTDIIPTVNYVLSLFLKRNEAAILLMYYRDGLKQREIGERLGLSSQRISQILSRARYHLKSNVIARRMLEYGIQGYIRYEKKNAEKVGFDKGFLKASVTTVTSICEIGLPLRAENCLIRSKHHTIGDVIAMTKSELREVKNLGNLMADTVIKKIEELGFEFKEE